jgi:hypothetical protein
LGSDGDDRAGFQEDGFVAFEQAGTNLWALQVLQDADRAAFVLGGAAQALDVVGVIFMRAVREVEASNIHAETKQVAHGRFGIARGADGANDLGAAGYDTFSDEVGDLQSFSSVRLLESVEGISVNIH